MKNQKNFIILLTIFVFGLTVILLTDILPAQSNEIRNEIAVPMQQSDAALIISAYERTMLRYMDSVEKNNELLSAQIAESNYKLDILLKKIENIEKALKIDVAQPAAVKTTTQSTGKPEEKKSEPQKQAAEKKDL